MKSGPSHYRFRLVLRSHQISHKRQEAILPMTWNLVVFSDAPARADLLLRLQGARYRQASPKRKGRRGGRPTTTEGGPVPASAPRRRALATAPARGDQRSMM